ncbi:unnamed protein product [Rotaria magnacalcarata]|nr:unnamed protein product [Rotaria magnacalcarata]
MKMKIIFSIGILSLIVISNVYGFTCKNDGFFANPSDVHTYYQCSSGVSYLISCLAGLVWNDTEKMCDWKTVDPITNCENSQQTNCYKTARWSTDGTIIVGMDSERGSDSQHLSSPLGVFVDTHNGNNVYVADKDNDRIQKFLGSSLSSGGITVAGGNGVGSAPNQLDGPVDVYVDKDENIYIADYGNHRIQMWPKDAISGITIAVRNDTSHGVNYVSFLYSMFFHEKTHTFYLPDYFHGRILKFTNGSNNGIIVAGNNGDVSTFNSLDGPTSVFVDDCETLYVTDSGNCRVQKYVKGASQGITVAGGYGRGNNASQLNMPYSLQVDKYKNLYILDTYNGRIQRWGPNDNVGVTIIGGHDFGNAANQLMYSYSLALDSEGNIFVSDLGNHRIQKFNILPETITC